MKNGMEVRSKYGGLRLTCDEPTFARIRIHILSEPTVAEAVGDSAESDGVQYIMVGRLPVENNSRGSRWLAVFAGIIASGFSGVALIVGFITIVQWLRRLIA
jgi:hypothetical protein